MIRIYGIRVLVILDDHILDMSPIPYHRLDPNGQFLDRWYVNQWMYTITGVHSVHCIAMGSAQCTGVCVWLVGWLGVHALTVESHPYPGMWISGYVDLRVVI